MSNFEYLVAGLPWLTLDYRYDAGAGFGTVVDQIREHLSERDNSLVDLLLEGFDPDRLLPDFYARVLKHRNRFLREYFRFDLNLRNAKVRFLNRELGREPDQDVMTGLGGEDDPDLDIDGYRFRGGEFEEADAAEAALSAGDLLARERALDELVWDKIDRLTVFDYFDIEAILGYLARLHIVDRWLALDPDAGREMMRRLVKQVRGSFKGVEFKEQ